MKPYGYAPSKPAPNIWTHTIRPTKFSLCVDDFGVKYSSEANADHLIQALQSSYEITIDKQGSNFCGLHLDWDSKIKCGLTYRCLIMSLKH